MVLNDFSTSSKSDTETRDLAAVQAFHWRKDPLLMLRRDAYPVIANTDDPFAAGCGDMELQAYAWAEHGW